MLPSTDICFTLLAIFRNEIAEVIRFMRKLCKRRVANKKVKSYWNKSTIMIP